MHSLTSALYGGEWSASRPGRFTPRERAPFTCWIGGWVGPRAGLDAVARKKFPAPARNRILKFPVNILNKQSRIADKGFYSSLSVGSGLTTPHCVTSLLRNFTEGLR